MSGFYIKPKIVVDAFNVEVLETFELGKEVLVLVSKTVRKQFKLNMLFEKLGSRLNLRIYDHVRPDAPFDDLDKIINEVGTAKLDAIIAIGGGSIIDAAKTLSVSFSGTSYKDVFYKRAEIPTGKIKVLAVPTTAGTGAELSFGAIIYDSHNKVKGGIRGEIVQPNYVLIDANFHNACPKKLKAEVGFDCLTHAVETYISQKSNPLVKNQSISCIKNIFDYLLPACNSNSLFAMEKIAISSALMGINLAYSSTCLPHRIQYVIGPLTGTSHAEGLIALYKGWIKNLVENNIEAFNNLAKDLGLDKNQLYNKIEALKEELDIEYSISDLGIAENQIQEIAEAVTGNVQADPSYRNLNTIVDVLKYSL